MSIDVRDLRSTIIPKSDQLNADQIVAGPIIITVTSVEAGSKDQPVTIHYEGEGGRPYKPGLTMRKVLLLAWGHDATQWVGRSMELFHEPSIKFGGELVGGIRISRMSHLKQGIKVSLAASKGKKALHEIGILRQSDELSAALTAIAAATGRDSMKNARALAEALKDPAELASAREAYRLRVSSLKEAAEKKAETAVAAEAPAGFDLDAFKTRAAACADLEALQVLSDEVEAMPDSDDKTAALAVLVERDGEMQ
jgi:hypothetical protein